jgi:gliding motility-associated-like protein
MFTTINQDDTQYGFSPNGDGINDFWTIDGIELNPDNTVSIYNRWGDLVFEIQGYDNQSNVFSGTANRKTQLGASELPSGTYFFNIQVSGEHNLNKLQGFLVLKR